MELQVLANKPKNGSIRKQTMMSVGPQCFIFHSNLLGGEVPEAGRDLCLGYDCVCCMLDNREHVKHLLFMESSGLLVG